MSSGGVGIVLVPPYQDLQYSSIGKHEIISLSFRFDIPCTNNQTKYEALVLVLFVVLEIGVMNLCVHGHSNLIIKQTDREIVIK